MKDMEIQLRHQFYAGHVGIYQSTSELQESSESDDVDEQVNILILKSQLINSAAAGIYIVDATACEVHDLAAEK